MSTTLGDDRSASTAPHDGPLPTAGQAPDRAAEQAAERTPGDTGSPDDGPRGGTGRRAMLGVAERYALVGLTVLLCVGFSLNPKSGPVFATLSNLNVVLGGQTAVAMVALAALFPLVAGHFDFSLGATASASTVLCAGLMSRHQVPLWLCLVACLGMGAVIGLVNGIAVTRYKMNPFVTTLGVATLTGGVILWYTGGKTIFQGVSESLLVFGTATLGGLPQVTVVVAVVALVAWYLLNHTPFGRSLYAIGSNRESARLVGLRVDRNVLLTFVIGGVIAAGAGVLQLSRTGSATADSGTAVLFPALAAVFLGATAIRPGFFNVVGTLVGTLFVSFAVSGLTISGATSWVSPVFNGAALLVAVALSTWLGGRRRAGG